MSSSTLNTGQFRPSSKDEFGKRAKHLSFLLNAPLQKSQSLLAQAYGFANVHDIQLDLQRAAERPADYPTGPYDEDLAATILNTPIPRDPAAPDFRLNVERDNRLIQIAADYAGTTPKEMPRRYWDILEMGLFSRPAKHRHLFNQIQAKYNELINDKPPEVGKTPLDYATLESSTVNEAIAAFSRQGRAVHDAIEEISADFQRTDDIRACVHAFDKLIERHPNNPWVHARYVIDLSLSFWQGPWDSPLTTSGSDPRTDASNADPGFYKHRGNLAKDLLPRARTAIGLFEVLYKGDPRQAASSKLASWSGQNGDDTYTYPAILYWGGVVALNAGDLTLAKRWLKANLKIEEGDPFGARFHLAIINLVTGTGPVSSLFPGDHAGSWCHMLKALDQLKKREVRAGVDLLTEALTDSPYLLRAWDPSFHDTDGIEVLNNTARLPSMQELVFRLKPFWRSSGFALLVLNTIFSHPQVRTAYLAYHFAKAGRYGVAFMPPGLAARKRSAEHLAREKLTTAVGAAAKAFV